jgi:predicted RNA binding protein YcfA (HicA-like mRNA interferase family)
MENAPAYTGAFSFLISIPYQPIDLIAQRIYRCRVKVRDVLRLIEQDGWYLVRTRGSHRQYKHPIKPGLVTLPGQPGDDLAPGTLNSVLKQAGLKP